MGARGVIPGRPYDRMGVAAYTLFASSDLQDQPFIGRAVRDESGLEAYYNFAIAPWLQLSANIQYIRPGFESNSNALVVGTRLFTQF
jgi:porin